MLSPVEEIKSRLDIADVIQGYVRLHKAGINYKALCPFHAEKTPSFFVSPTRQIWHCFGGCGKGGDIFKFIMEIEGLDFPEALRLLAIRAGVVLRREDPSIRSERNRLYDICETAAQIFTESLQRTPATKKYLSERGVKDETVRDFRLGFAPQSWDFLLKLLLQKGFRREDVEKAGLAVKSEDGQSWYDRFRSRIMFPIADVNGHIIGFGGRIFALPSESLSARQAGLAKEGMKSSSAKATEDAAKYINTPQTMIYDKSRVLYGFDKSKQEIRSKNQVVIVEGYMDCVMSYQAGVKNTIAVSGTALTPQQLTALKRLCDTMISSFDTDSAGEGATKRSLALAAQFEFERKIASIPIGKDPADAVLENPDAWKEAVERAEPVVEFYFGKARRQYNPRTPDGKKAIAGLLVPYIAELANEVEKAHWVGELSSLLNIREEAVWAELQRYRPAVPYTPAEDVSRNKIAVSTRRLMLEERFLALFPLVRDETRARLMGHNALVFSSVLNQELFGVLTKIVPQQTAIEPHLQEALELLRFKGEVLGTITKNLEDEFTTCGRELEKVCIKEQLFQVGSEIQHKERANDMEGTTQLLKNFQELSVQLKQLS
ncbi:MAG: hypothetical protein A3C07_01990 [Candidatus Sungbacteria bacterium RIFCSPHIGHO2_02_FULL_47_11]|uniref:DNA primase n=1 Tax=Candidatus Sungbacteria bacterium RIFCSPHIGHO2_02_FULL_47_11 TaxID=1802270 RepID=A0A1G2KMZ9_9BACT|nr:MAG: hypothetical protein A3C07_01990 [Candidatus Sungbacteria bacterium RIFCSPHIGHO2_02_FULL_47_11]